MSYDEKLSLFNQYLVFTKMLEAKFPDDQQQLLSDDLIHDIGVLIEKRQTIIEFIDRIEQHHADSDEKTRAQYSEVFKQIEESERLIHHKLKTFYTLIGKKRIDLKKVKKAASGYQKRNQPAAYFVDKKN